MPTKKMEMFLSAKNLSAELDDVPGLGEVSVNNLKKKGINTWSRCVISDLSTEWHRTQGHLFPMPHIYSICMLQYT